MWNEIIKIRDNKKTPPDEKRMAEMLLRQLNTAGGQTMLKSESESFIERNKQLVTS